MMDAAEFREVRRPLEQARRGHPVGCRVGVPRLHRLDGRAHKVHGAPGHLGRDPRRVDEGTLDRLGPGHPILVVVLGHPERVHDRVEEAVYLAYYLEEACRIQVATLSQGVPYHLPTIGVISEAHEALRSDRSRAATQFFEAFRRRLPIQT